MSRGGWRFAAAGVVAALTVTATVADAQAERVRWKMHSAYATNIAVLGEAPGVVSETVEKLSDGQFRIRSEEHTSELQSLMRISYAVFCLKKKLKQRTSYITN